MRCFFTNMLLDWFNICMNTPFDQLEGSSHGDKGAAD